MTSSRPARWIATTVLAVSVLAACGGSDDEPTIKPTSTAQSSAAAQDPDGFTPEQRAVADAVDAYTAAFFGRGATAVEPAVRDLVTKKMLDALVPAETEAVDDAGLQYIGTVTIEPESVTISGDEATFTGCSDGSKAFVVKRGEDSAGVGSRPVGIMRLTAKLQRDGERWLIDEPRGEVVDAC